MDPATFDKVVAIARDTAATLAELRELNRSEQAKLDSIIATQQAQSASLLSVSNALAALATNTKEGRDSAVREVVREFKASNGVVLLAGGVIAAGTITASLIRVLWG